MNKRQKKTLFRIVIAASVFVFSMFAGKLPMLQIIFLFTAYLSCGGDILFAAVRKIFTGQIFDEEFLMSAATIGAIALGEYNEAVMVMLLYQTGELFQSVAVGKSRKSIKELMKIKPDYATLILEDGEFKLPPEEINVGDIILVLPGEKVPLDGVITEGRTSFDSSSLTGESIPITADYGDRAVSGMINLESPVKIKVTAPYEESTVAKILQLVEQSAANKSVSEKFITKFSRKYTPCVFAAALITALIPPIMFGLPFSVWVKRALVFLIVSCPCALVISVPLTFFGGIGAASQKGILIKGSNYIERLSKTHCIAFDKTGTLTCGKFTVTEINSQGIEKEKLLELAAMAESHCVHPIAKSIVEAYKGEIDKARVKNVTMVSGGGVIADVDGENILAGNSKFLKDNGIDIENIQENGTIVYVAKGGKYIGNIVIEDKVKSDALQTIKDLNDMGIRKAVILTGDNYGVAKKVADKLGIKKIYARLLPQEKVETALDIKETGKGTFVFVGDGVNDAPVIACADVGVAMGALGTDAAIEAADVVIMNDSLSALSDLIRISRRTMSIVKQNIIMALSVKFAVMILSAAGLANMYGAVFADVGVMIVAILNAMRNLFVVSGNK